MATVAFTQLTFHPPTAEFPTYIDGYDSLGNLFRHVFDFSRGWGYEAIYCGSTTTGGIEVVDLDTFTVIQLPSYNSMYAGTPYGNVAGVAPSQVGEVSCGNGTNVYLSMPGPHGSGTNVKNRLARVDPTTWKVTGEFYLNDTSTGCIFNARHGIVNKIGTTDIVAYLQFTTSNYNLQIFNGASMTLIGSSTAALRWSGANGTFAIPGARNPGSCDFWIVSSNAATGGIQGQIDLWKVTVQPNGPIITTLSGTVDGLALWPGVAAVAAWRADYDTTHGNLILWVGGGDTWNDTQTAPAIVASVTQTGSIVWTYAVTRNTAPSLGSTLLNGTLVGVLYDGHTFNTLDTATGELVQTFDIILPSGVPTANEQYYSAYGINTTTHYGAFLSFNIAVANYTLRAPLPPRAATPKLWLLRQPELHLIGPVGTTFP